MKKFVGPYQPKPISVEKPRGAFHPKGVAKAYPLHRFWATDLGNEAQYGTLTDNTPFREYAWEFLRRNRLFQQEQDQMRIAKPHRAQPLISEETYGFQSSPDRPPTWGLSKPTDYSQGYTYTRERQDETKQEVSVQWLRAASFLEQFKTRSGPRSNLNTLGLEFPDSQVGVVFDIDPLHYGTAALELQLAIARDKLLERIEAAGYAQHHISTPQRQRRILRELLRTIDLFSEKESYSLAEVSNKLSAYESATASPPYRSKEAMESKVSTDAGMAFTYVYEGMYLGLLNFDPWPWEEVQLTVSR